MSSSLLNTPSIEEPSKVPEVIEEKKAPPRKSSMLAAPHDPKSAARKRSVTFRPALDVRMQSIDLGDEETDSAKTNTSSVAPKVNNVKEEDEEEDELKGKKNLVLHTLSDCTRCYKQTSGFHFLIAEAMDEVSIWFLL